MPKRIAIIDGHPDPDPARFNHALAEAYRAGAVQGGHEVSLITLGSIDVPLLRSQERWIKEPAPETLREAQQIFGAADHLVFLYPLWLGDMPAVLKAFLEQVARPGFAFEYGEGGRTRELLKGKSARIVVTMGMPAFIYRWYFGAHSLRSFKRSILKFIGISPVRTTLIGGVAGLSEAKRERWLNTLRALGREAR